MEKVVRFTENQLQFFRALSYDTNPLHYDLEYSQATQFGKVVVHGMCAVLTALGIWAKGRKFRICSMQGKFKKPLFLGVPYSLKITENRVGSREEVELALIANNFTHVLIKFSSAIFEGETFELNRSPKFSPRHNPVADGTHSLPSPDYFLNPSALSQLEQTLGLSPAQLPISQLNAFAWASYLVGMEVPGLQALFSDFKFEFSGQNETFKVPKLKIEVDSRFKKFEITGNNEFFKSVQIGAFARPQAVKHSIQDMLGVLPTSESYKGKTVLVSGASRGFGAALATGFAIQGARVILGYCHSHTAVQELARDLDSLGAKTLLLKGDLRNEKDCLLMREILEGQNTPIDILVDNAFPSIPLVSFFDQSSEESLAFFHDSVMISSNFLRTFMPLLKENGMVVSVSSIFTQVPEKKYSHYIAAKAAVEELTRSLTAEFSEKRFVVLRPPRMLTDRNNLPYDPMETRSPIEVASQVVQRLVEIEDPFSEINF